MSELSFDSRSSTEVDANFALHINNFDFIRFVAALSVLVSHSYPIWGGVHDPLQPLMNGFTIGEVAVSVFFVVSGYLVAQSWGSDPNIFRFLARRLLRLCPALYTLILISTFVAGPLLTSLPLHDYLASSMTWNYLKGFGLLWVQGQLPGVFEASFYPLAFNGPLWTIPIETSCYLILLIGGILGFSRSPFTSLILGVGTAFLSVVVSADVDYYKNFHFVHMDVVSFLKLAALFFLSASIFHYRVYIPRLTGVAVAMLVVIFFSSGTRFFDLIFLIFFPYAILCLAFIPNKTISQFGKFGDYSYGMYLYAWPVQQAVMQFFGVGLSFFAYVLISALITLFFAYLSWHCVEKCALRLKPINRSAELSAPPLSIT